MDLFFENIHEFFIQTLLTFLCSSALNWLIIQHFYKFPHAELTEAEGKSQQATHIKPTPRLGGAAVILSFAVLVGFNAPQLKTELLAPLLATAIVFLVGIKEDIYRNVPPKFRLAAAFVSAGSALYFSDSMITHLDFPGETALLGVGGLWVVITLVWSAGTCHAFNLIDGLNGLLSGYAIIASIALWLIATNAGDPEISMIALALVGSLLGFFIFNWPSGRIFLGDAGAYSLGHIIAWLGIMLSYRNPDLSPLALLLLLFWPVADTAFTIGRRVTYKKAIGQPDKLHFHHIVFRILLHLTNGRLNKRLVNSLSALIMYPLMVVPILLGIAFWNEPFNALPALLVCIINFMALNIIGLKILAKVERGNKNLKLTKQLPEITPTFERSKYSGIYIQESLAVDVIITRRDSAGKWTLQAIADQAPGRLWTNAFDTDLDAWNAFMETIERDGIEAMVGFPSKQGRAFTVR